MRSMSNISKMIARYASWPAALVLLALQIGFNATLLADFSTKLAHVTGGGGPIDLLFFYTPQTAYGLVDAYGPVMRAEYRTFELTVDIAYPIVYTLFAAFAISLLFRRAFGPDSRLMLLNTVPLGAWLFDLLENLAIVGMLSAHPAEPDALAWAGTVFTMLKWLFAGLSLLLVLTGAIAAVRRRLDSPRQS